jgi:diaminobutyrate-2-oxoglutarate transaminase
MADKYGFSTRGKGMMRGIDVGSGEMASKVTSDAFDKGLIIETSGAFDEVVKVLAPLTITEAEMAKGLDILDQSIRHACSQQVSAAA